MPNIQPTEIYSQFIAKDNFIKAYQRVAAKGSRGGIDQLSPLSFAQSFACKLDHLIASLKSGTYTPEPVTAVHVPKLGKKEGEFRELGLPTVADKIVQTALLQVLEPVTEKLFLDTSYGYRPGKGATKALRRVEHYLSNQHLTWLVNQDIDNFFDTLNHSRLLALFSELVGGNQRLVELVALWCKMGIVQRDGRWRNVMTGVRQGQVISPLLANLYLHGLDRFVQERGWGWVRYADDFLLLCRDKEEAEIANHTVEEFLNGIHLRLNNNPSPITSIAQGFDFLGVHFLNTHRSISPNKIAKMYKTVEWLLSAKSRLDLPKILEKLSAAVTGWSHYYSFLSPWEEFSLLNQQIETGLKELLLSRHIRGLVTKDEIKDLEVPRLPDKDSLFAAKTSCTPLLALWKEKEATDQPAARKTAKKIGKRRREYVRKEISGSELFVATPGAFVGKRGERIVVRNKNTLLGEMPAARLQTLTVAGAGVCLSSDVIRLCADRGISLTFLDNLGKPYAVTRAPEGVNTILVLRQIKNRDSEIGLQLARMFVWAKMKNQLALLKSYNKYHSRHHSNFAQDFAGQHQAMDRLILDVKSITYDDPGAYRQALMGLEGRFAAHYWRLIAELLPQDCQFSGRNKQGAADLINVLLNYGYGILYNHTLRAVIKSGLNASVGFLHACQQGKPALVFDLIEEFRAMAVDRVVFTLANRHEEMHLEKDHQLPQESRKKLAGSVLARLGGLVHLHGQVCSLHDAIYRQAVAVRDCLMHGAGYNPYLARW